MAKNNTVKDVELGVKIKPVVEDIKNISDLAKILTADSSSIDRRKMSKPLHAIEDIGELVNKLASMVENTVGTFSKVTNSVSKMFQTFKDASDFTNEKLVNAKANLTSFAMKEGNLAQYVAGAVGEGDANVLTKVVNGFDKLLEDMITYSDLTPEELQKSFDNLTKVTEKTVHKDIEIATNRIAMDEKKHQKNLEHMGEIHQKRMEQNLEKHLQSMQFAEEKHQQSIRMNQETHDIAMSQRTAWFDQLKQFGLKGALFGYEEFTARQGAGGLNPQGTTSKRIVGILGQDLKAGILGGIKGGIIGAVVGLIFKALGTIKKVLMMPLEVGKKLATGIFNTLKKTMTGAETFKKLIELVMLPFTLLFTLLFAPILVKLAPLLVDLVNQVVSKWDVLEGVGDKIAEVLEYFFDENQWFSFSNIIDTIINVLDELSTIAYNTFNSAVNAGRTGLEVLTDVAVTLVFEIADKIINFLMSGECFSLMTSIGTIVGTVLYNGLKVAITSLVPLFEGIGGLLGGFVGSFIYDMARYAYNLIKQKAVELMPFLSALSEFQNIDTSTKFSNTISAGQELLNYISNGVSSSGSTTTNNITSYQTNNYQSNILGGYSNASKDTGWA